MSYARLARTAVVLALVASVAATGAVVPATGSTGALAATVDDGTANETDESGLLGALDGADASVGVEATTSENASLDADATVEADATAGENATADGAVSVGADATAGTNATELTGEAGVDADGESGGAGANVDADAAVDGSDVLDGATAPDGETASDDDPALDAIVGVDAATVGDELSATTILDADGLDATALAVEARVGSLLEADLATSAVLAASDAGGAGDAQTAPQEEDSGDGDDDDRESRSAAAGETGTDGDDGGVPVPDDLGAGVAVGSLAVGAGLAARRATTIAGTSAGAGGGATLSTAVEWLRAWGWRLAGLAGYQRFDDTDPLEHETRAAIYEHLEDEPGAFLTEIGEATDVPLSTLRYHLRILAFENLVTDVEVRGKRRFFPADVDPDALETALEDDATAAVLEALAREPDSVSGLAERLERDPSTVSHHLQRLDDEGLVERERDGRSVVNRLADGLDVDRVATGGRVASSAD